MDKALEDKLVRAIFGEGYGEGLPVLSFGKGYDWERDMGYRGSGDELHAKDIAGNWWTVQRDYTID